MDALNDWLRGIPNLLTGFAAYSWGAVPEAELVSCVLKRAERRLDCIAAGPNGLDLDRFLQRARESEQPLIRDAWKGVFI